MLGKEKIVEGSEGGDMEEMEKGREERRMYEISSNIIYLYILKYLLGTVIGGNSYQRQIQKPEQVP